MSNESGFNWKYLIPGYGIYLINKSEMQGKGKFIALNVIIILIVLGIIGSGPENTTTASSGGSNVQTSEQGAQEQTSAWKVGDTIKTEKFEIKVSSVTNRGSVGGQYLSEKAPDGAVFVVVNFSYKNISKEPVTSFSMPEVKIVDPNGTAYDEAVAATGYYQTEIDLNKKSLSDLNPGITQKDAIVFEVSKDLWKSNGWKLVIDADEDLEVVIK
ncbi:MAG TPA: DUF4352 domain-containing protein [Spirochaetota bacterium]|nr:DUF4352 domain-containing protein [Spirochaetota bacterium]